MRYLSLIHCLSLIFSCLYSYLISASRPICSKCFHLSPTILSASLSHLSSIPRRLHVFTTANQSLYLRDRQLHPISLCLRANGTSDCFSCTFFFYLLEVDYHSSLDAEHITNQTCKAVSLVTWIYNTFYVTGKGLNLSKR